jgi:hypothetical protein
MAIWKIIIGLLLIIIGYFGHLFFRNYHGHVIVHKDIYHNVSLLMICIGLRIIYFGDKRSKRNSDDEQ